MSKPKPKPQIERFREAAREHDTNDSPEELERVFGKIVPLKRPGDVAHEGADERKRRKGIRDDA